MNDPFVFTTRCGDRENGEETAMNIEHEDEVEIADFGSVTQETKGAIVGEVDIEGQPRQLFGVIIDD